MRKCSQRGRGEEQQQQQQYQEDDNDFYNLKNVPFTIRFMLQSMGVDMDEMLSDYNEDNDCFGHGGWIIIVGCSSVVRG